VISKINIDALKHARYVPGLVMCGNLNIFK